MRLQLSGLTGTTASSTLQVTDVVRVWLVLGGIVKNKKTDKIAKHGEVTYLPTETFAAKSRQQSRITLGIISIVTYSLDSHTGKMMSQREHIEFQACVQLLAKEPIQILSIQSREFLSRQQAS